MAPRANWKGFLRLSLVTCPIALFPATSESEKISFNQINKQTGNRIRYLKVDADTGDEVASCLRTSSRATRSTQTGILK
jgi:DNA end-binding protein Ku